MLLYHAGLGLGVHLTGLLLYHAGLGRGVHLTGLLGHSCVALLVRVAWLSNHNGLLVVRVVVRVIVMMGVVVVAVVVMRVVMMTAAMMASVVTAFTHLHYQNKTHDDATNGEENVQENNGNSGLAIVVVVGAKKGLV